MPKTTLLCLGLILVIPALGESHQAKFQHEMAARLRKDHAQLKVLRLAFESEPGYILSEDAYMHAMNDLDVFGHDPDVTEERLRNDVRELEFDLHELADSHVSLIGQPQ
jgi:hypothetical protein